MKLCKAKQHRCHKSTKTHDISLDTNIFCIHCQNSDHSSILKSCTMFTILHNISFKEAETIGNNPSYTKITTNNRFHISRNYENFSSVLQNNSNSQRIAIPPAKNSTFLNVHKKRIAASPPQTPLTPKKIIPFKNSNNPIIPNPYKDEFMTYKEKIINQT